jgi:hypothetical protein
MSKRTGAEEVARFKKRVRELHEKEARCPACWKARLANPTISDDLKARVKDPEVSGHMPPCWAHRDIRVSMAISGMKTWG